MVSTSVMHVKTRINTYLLIQEGWEAELAVRRMVRVEHRACSNMADDEEAVGCSRVQI